MNSNEKMTMLQKHEAEKLTLVRRLAGRARKQIGKGSRADRDGVRFFVERFYANVPPEDLQEKSEKALLAAALSAWDLFQTRKSGQARVRVFNPGTAKKGGWDCTHTVVEVVNDDMPFLVDSLTAELNQRDITVHLVIHPVVDARRDKAGKLIEVGEAEPGETASAESVMQIEIDEQPDGKPLTEIKKALEAVLSDVRAAVTDWRRMRVRVADVIAELDAAPPPIGRAEIEETKSFLRWIEDNHFTFLGYREYSLTGEGKKIRLEIVPKSGLGILRNKDVSLFDGLQDMGTLPPDIADFIRKPQALLVAKANRRSTVHRAVHLDTICVKRFDKDGAVIGERFFTGLFASDVYNQAVREIPLLRGKVDTIFSQVGFHPSSHDGKALMHIIETLPRDELLQVDATRLMETCVGILHLQDRQRVALFVHRDPFGRFASCLVYVPRDRFATDLRLAMQKIIEEGFAGTVTAHYTQVGDSALARLHFIVKRTPGEDAPLSDDEIEDRLAEAARSWEDELSDALIASHGEKTGIELFRRFEKAFAPGYRSRFKAEQAVKDIDRILEIRETGAINLNLHRADDDAEHEFRFGLYRLGEPVALSDVLPMLENMGLKVTDEVPHSIGDADSDDSVWLHDFGLTFRAGAPVEVDDVKAPFEEAFRRVWLGEMENDGFNSLILGASLTWRQVVILRAYCKYLLQAKIPFSQSYMEETLARNPAITRDIVRLFETMFDPAGQKKAAADAKKINASIMSALDEVVSLDQDRILRRFANAVNSTLRTNFYQTGEDGSVKPALSLKLDSSAIDELPLPRPFREIFVHSPRVDAVHLRGGMVARGGLRWSDRREDFRTEILGLMKSQMTKNAVIVPVGAKGGFVVKNPSEGGDREAGMAEGIECYKTFIRGMLDITDNIVKGKIVAPKDVVRRDDDDPYLVVAADKGTATFSDIANGVARDYGFWLDDAFASGGSEGYDHKAMGITARGAWESVKRHFREIGTDVMEEDFTCVGVGDMSGDVFGNGMICSPHTKLIGAFNHLHIFVDPDPDPAASYKERKRLFDMGRSSWTDYNEKLISKGGGIFDRAAKSIKISPEMRAAFGLGKRDSMTPNELIREMLKAKVDLLWFGGIGTYVKAGGESDLDVGDRANDALRINGGEVGARIIGEGANLGITQRGRVEYALAGGRINTDFIDNSAGVDCSDHEVNIKILLGDVVAANKLTMKARNKLLRDMTDEVAELVLMDNYRQSMALTNSEHQAVALVDEHKRFIQMLEKSGDLNREVEFLPDDETIDTRAAAGKGLTRPELSVLLAYAKITLFEDILESELPDDDYLADNLRLYFPEPMQKKFADFIPKHRLRREIIATYATNTLINRTGPSFITTMQSRTGARPSAIARAYLMCRRVYDIAELWNGVEALDNSVPAEKQTEMHLEILDLLQRGTLWFLRSVPSGTPIDQAVSTYRKPVAKLTSQLDDILSADLKRTRDRRAESYIEKKVPADLAHRISNLDALVPACDIVRIAGSDGLDHSAVAKVFYGLGARFGFDWLRASAEGLADGDEWRNAAVHGLIDDLYACQTELTTRVMDDAGGADVADLVIDAWVESNAHDFARVKQTLADLRASTPLDLAMMMVASRELRALIRN